MAELGSLAAASNALETAMDPEFAKSLLPPIGSRGSRRAEFTPGSQEVDKFSRAMDMVLADRAQDGGLETSHVIARGENQMAAKHGITKMGKGVVDKFRAAAHNTALMSAMGHPGLEKLVAREEEEKRRRRARLKELTAQRMNLGSRATLRSGGEGGPAASGPSFATSTPDLPNVYAALGRLVPASRAASTTTPGGAAGAAAAAAALQQRGGTGIGVRGGEAEGPPVRTRRQPGGRWRRRAQAAHIRAARSGEAAILSPTSRVGAVLAEFGGQDDWCSVTVMRHRLATILQANVRGWLVRRRWLTSPQAVVDATKAALEAERASAARRVAMKAELERRALTRKQKEKAAGVLQMLFPQRSVAGVGRGGGGGGGSGSGSGSVGGGGLSLGRSRWNRLNKNIDIVKEQVDRADVGDYLDDSGSELSDMGLEDVALVKMRARTPPWQKAEQSQWEGQWAKLTQRTGRGNLDVVWDLADTAARVQAVRQRRAERLIASAPAASSLPSSSGEDSSPVPYDPLTQPYDPANQPLPSTVVTDLLLQRYVDKYTRLGLLDHLPLRSAAETALLLQQQQQMPMQPQGQQAPVQMEHQMQLWQQQQHIQQLRR